MEGSKTRKKKKEIINHFPNEHEFFPEAKILNKIQERTL